MIRSLFLLLLIIAGCSFNMERVDLNGPWYFRADSLDQGLQEKWYSEETDRSQWLTVAVPDHWERYNLPSYDGVGWFSTTFEFDGGSESMALFFGGVDDDADVWLNGQKIGSHTGYSEAFAFEIGNYLRRGTNLLVVRVVDFAGPGGIYKPVSLLPSRRIAELLRSKYADLSARPSAEWVKSAIIYEVYLRSFSPEGTFKALEQRLSELRELGVTVLWLMPIHPVGNLHRKGTLGSPYAVEDYYTVNPEFGTMEDFRSLVSSVHRHGMRIIIDLVANHTAWDSKLMREHPEWFTRGNDGTIIPPNDDWTDVADLDYGHPELWDYMIEMMKFWVRDVGIDGFRCDVAELVPTPFWNRARKELDAIKPVMMLSEGTLPEHHVEAFDLTYAWNMYDILTKVIAGSASATLFHELVRNESFQFPKGSLRMRFNTNHDKNAWDMPAVKKFTHDGAKATAVLMFTFPGVPLVYNGEEVGNDRRLDLFEKVEIDWTKNADFRRLYRRLAHLRREYPSLVQGEYRPLENSHHDRVISFMRASADQVIVVVNLSGQKMAVEVQVSLPHGQPLKDCFTSERVLVDPNGLFLSLEPFGYKVFAVAGN
jgi:glycosidase